MFEKVWKVYFSPSGTTKVVVEKISESISESKNFYTLNLLTEPVISEQVFGPNDLVIIGVPVFVGRVPEFCTKQLELFKGEKTPVIATVIYGNRAYEDSLLELTNLLLERDFMVVGAAAFVAQHSLFPKVGANRPDESDFNKIENFSKLCLEKINNVDEIKHLEIKGNYPYREYMVAPMIPTGNESCTNCKKCVDICPVKAIDSLTPTETDGDLCIRCTACIAVCPVQSRKFYGPMYEASYTRFIENFSKRVEPEIYI